MSFNRGAALAGAVPLFGLSVLFCWCSVLAVAKLRFIEALAYVSKSVQQTPYCVYAHVQLGGKKRVLQNRQRISITHAGDRLFGKILSGGVIEGNKGYVYVLQNPAFPDKLKIGFTTRTPEERAQELSRQTGVPLPFKVVYSEQFLDCKKAEREVHRILGAKRTDGKEFFTVSLADAIAAIERCKQHEQRIYERKSIGVKFRPIFAHALMLFVVAVIVLSLVNLSVNRREALDNSRQPEVECGTMSASASDVHDEESNSISESGSIEETVYDLQPASEPLSIETGDIAPVTEPYVYFTEFDEAIPLPMLTNDEAQEPDQEPVDSEGTSTGEVQKSELVCGVEEITVVESIESAFEPADLGQEFTTE